MVTGQATSISPALAVPCGASLRDSGACFVRWTQELATTAVYLAVQIADANGPSGATLSDEAQAEGTAPSSIDARTFPACSSACSSASASSRTNPDRTPLEDVVRPTALLDFPSEQRKQVP
jgi:hypothetical protein